jgi:hypothetical protein
MTNLLAVEAGYTLDLVDHLSLPPLVVGVDDLHGAAHDAVEAKSALLLVNNGYQIA